MHSDAQKFSILASFDRFDIKSFQKCKNLFTKMSRTLLINPTSLATLAMLKIMILVVKSHQNPRISQMHKSFRFLRILKDANEIFPHKKSVSTKTSRKFLITWRLWKSDFFPYFFTLPDIQGKPRCIKVFLDGVF